MTFQQPMNLQALCYTAEEDRQALQAVVCEEGVVDTQGGDLLVTTGGAALDLSVAAGGTYVEGDDTADQGMYRVRNDGATTLTGTGAASPGPGEVVAGVPDADGTNPRIDQVIVRVRDSEYSGLDNDSGAYVLTGTPSVGATLTNLTGAASLPDNTIRLAYILVPAGFAGPFVNATHILDARTGYRECGVDRWHTVGATGEPAFGGSWVNFGGSDQVAQYRRVGDMVQLRGVVKDGTSGATMFTLPTGYRPPATHHWVQFSATSTGAATLNVDSAGLVTVLGYLGTGANTSVVISTQFSVSA